jgi:NAD(P)-dependent dehydrogenase (short-subunit alcohol dehydrogenase family)
MSKVFFVTGAGRGMGTDNARAALAAGHQVVATGRRPEAVEERARLHGNELRLRSGRRQAGDDLSYSVSRRTRHNILRYG